MWDKAFRGGIKLQKAPESAAVIVSSKINKKIGGHLSILLPAKYKFSILKTGWNKDGSLPCSKVPIPCCRVVDQMPILCKAGAVAGTIPAVLLRIPFQCTAQMGAAPRGGRQQVDHRLQTVGGMLREGENTSPKGFSFP